MQRTIGTWRDERQWRLVPNQERVVPRRSTLHGVSRAVRCQRFREDLFDGVPSRSAGFVLRELDADALGAVALNALGRHPHHFALNRDRLRIVPQRQQHEYFLAELVVAAGGNEDAAALEERHVRGVQRGLFPNVERKYARS